MENTFSKDLISSELAGKNIEYKILKDAIDPAHPKADEVRYSDKYISRLNELYPVNEIFGEDIDAVARGNGVAQYMNNILIKNHHNIPAIHGKVLLEVILTISANAKQWQPYIFDISNSKNLGEITTAHHYLDKVEKIDSKYRINSEDGLLMCGLAVAKHNNLAIPTVYQNKIIVVPSQTFVEYIANHK